ncbi:unnamed protein product [Cochlearia groenlandica]
MVDAIPKPIKDIWDAWSIRTTLIFSLSLQTFLIFFAPQRKRTSRKLFLSLIWSAYLLADWAANFAAGQISDSQGDDPEPGEPLKKAELLAFWLPFLLLHLGGPDTITALALEDNELWLRHLLGLGFQAVATVYVLLQSLPNALMTPMLFVFAAGIIKYIERTLALYLASLDKFKDSMIQRPDPGPNYAKLMEEYASKKAMNIPTRIIKIDEAEKDPKASLQVRPLRDFTNLDILQYAYKYFNIFKGLVVDLIFTFKERAESKRFFGELNPVEALRILEVELNFIYEALFTKAEILHNRIGILFRFIALGCLAAALRIFQYKKKNDYDGFDVSLTYALLIGGIALDSIALIMFCLSDWTFVRVSSLIDKMHKRISHKVNAVSRTHHFARITIHPFYFGFLSRIPHFIKSVWAFLSEFFDISDTLDKIRKTMYVHGEPMTKQLWELMFEELKNKSKFGDSPENARKISLARGEWTLRDTLPEDADREKLIEHVTNVDYDQSILMWHIATELCYQSSDTISKDYDECTHYSNREFSKIISDYMMYLMILQPGLMSEVAGIGKIRFRDTLAEAEKFFERRQIENKGNLKLATETLLDVKSDITDPMSVKGDRSKSVLFDACRLAKDLMLLEERFGKNKWEILSKVWVELLCHAACHCDPTAHVEQLSRGGELINFVWLLMAHFGLTDQFQINKGDARAKLIIGK